MKKKTIGEWTKEEFDQKLDQKLDQKMPEYLKPLHEKIDKLYTLLDTIAGNFRNHDDEIILLSERQSTHSDDIEKLDTRVTRIETHLQFPVNA